MSFYIDEGNMINIALAIVCITVVSSHYWMYRIASTKRKDEIIQQWFFDELLKEKKR